MGNCCPQQTNLDQVQPNKSGGRKVLQTLLTKEQIRQIRIKNLEKQPLLQEEEQKVLNNKNHSENQIQSREETKEQEQNQLKNSVSQERSIQQNVKKQKMQDQKSNLKEIKSKQGFNMQQECVLTQKQNEDSSKKEEENIQIISLNGTYENVIKIDQLQNNEEVEMRISEENRLLYEQIKEQLMPNFFLPEMQQFIDVRYDEEQFLHKQLRNQFIKNEQKKLMIKKEIDCNEQIQKLKIQQQQGLYSQDNEACLLNVKYNSQSRVFSFEYGVQDQSQKIILQQDVYLDINQFEVASQNAHILSTIPLFNFLGCNFLQIDQQQLCIYKQSYSLSLSNIINSFQKSRIKWTQHDIESLLLFWLQVIVSLYEQKLYHPNLSIESIGIIISPSKEHYLFQVNGLEHCCQQLCLYNLNIESKKHLIRQSEIKLENILYFEVKKACETILNILIDESNKQTPLFENQTLNSIYPNIIQFSKIFLKDEIKKPQIQIDILLKKIDEAFPRRFSQIQFLTKSIILDQLYEVGLNDIKKTQEGIETSQFTTDSVKKMKQNQQFQIILQATNTIQEFIFFIVVKKLIYEYSTEEDISYCLDLLSRQLGKTDYEQELFYMTLFNFLQVLIMNKLQTENVQRFVYSLLICNSITSNKIALHYLIDLICFMHIQDENYDEAFSYIQIITDIIKEGQNLDSFYFKKQIILIRFFIYLLQKQSIEVLQQQYSKYERVQQILGSDDYLNSFNLLIRPQYIEYLIHFMNNHTYKITHEQLFIYSFCTTIIKLIHFLYLIQRDQKQENFKVFSFLKTIYPHIKIQLIGQDFLALFAYLQNEQQVESQEKIKSIKGKIKNLSNNIDTQLLNQLLSQFESIQFCQINYEEKLKESLQMNKKLRSYYSLSELSELSSTYQSFIFKNLFDWIELFCKKITVSLANQIFDIESLDNTEEETVLDYQEIIQNNVEINLENSYEVSDKTVEIIKSLLQIDPFIFLEPFGIINNRTSIMVKQDFTKISEINGNNNQYKELEQKFSQFYERLKQKKEEFLLATQNYKKDLFDIHILHTIAILGFHDMIKVQTLYDSLNDVVYSESIYTNLYLFKKHIPLVQTISQFPFFKDYFAQPLFIDVKNWSYFTQGAEFNLQNLKHSFQVSQNKIPEELITYALCKLLSLEIRLHEQQLYFGNYQLENISFYKDTSNYSKQYSLKVNDFGSISNDLSQYFETKTVWKYQNYCKFDQSNLVSEQILFAEVYNICMVIAELIIDEDNSLLEIYQMMQKQLQAKNQNQLSNLRVDELQLEFNQTIQDKLKEEIDYYSENLIEFILQILSIDGQNQNRSLNQQELLALLEKFDLIDYIEGRNQFKSSFNISEDLKDFIRQTVSYNTQLECKISQSYGANMYYLNYYSNKSIYLSMFQNLLSLTEQDSQVNYIQKYLFVQQYIYELIIKNSVQEINQDFLNVFFQVGIKVLKIGPNKINDLMLKYNQNYSQNKQNFIFIDRLLSNYSDRIYDGLFDLIKRSLIHIAFQLKQHQYLKNLDFFDRNQENYESQFLYYCTQITISVLENKLDEAKIMFEEIDKLIIAEQDIQEPININYVIPLIFFSWDLQQNSKFMKYYIDQLKKYNKQILNPNSKISTIQNYQMNKILYLINVSILVMLISFNKFEEALKLIQTIKQKYLITPLMYSFEYEVQFNFLISQLEVVCRVNLKLDVKEQVQYLQRLRKLQNQIQTIENNPQLFQNIIAILNSQMLSVENYVLTSIQSQANEEQDNSYQQYQIKQQDDREPFEKMLKYLIDETNFPLSKLSFSEYSQQVNYNQINKENTSERINLYEQLRNSQNLYDNKNQNQEMNENTMTISSYFSQYKQISNKQKNRNVEFGSQFDLQNNEQTLSLTQYSKTTVDQSTDFIDQIKNDETKSYQIQKIQSNKNIFDNEQPNNNDQTIQSNNFVIQFSQGQREITNDQTILQSYNQNSIQEHQNEQHFKKQSSSIKLLKIGELGKGGFGNVSIYYDNETGQQIAVKQYNDIEEYRQEKNILLKFKQPNSLFSSLNKYICQLIDFDDSECKLVLEMGLSSLYEATEILKSQQTGYSTIFLISILDVMITFCLELNKLKSYHGDIKPQNIIISSDQKKNQFQQNFGILNQMIGIEIKLIDFGSFSTNPNNYYDYVSPKYKCMLFENQVNTNNFTWEQILFAEVVSCCRTVFFSMKLDLQNQYLQYNSNSSNQEISSIDNQSMKLFQFLDIFLNETSENSSIFKKGISIPQLQELQKQHLKLNDQNLQFINFEQIQQQIWKKIQIDEQTQGKINNKYTQVQLRACNFRNKVLNSDNVEQKDFQSLCTQTNLQELIHTIFLLNFYFDLNQNEYDSIARICEYIIQQGQFTSQIKTQLLLEVSCFFQLNGQKELLKQILKLTENINNYQLTNFEQVISIQLKNYIENQSNFSEVDNSIIEQYTYQESSFFEIYLLYSLLKPLQEASQDDIQYNSQKFDELDKWFTQNSSNFNIYKKQIYYYIMIIINAIIREKHEEAIENYKQYKKLSKMLNKQIEQEILLIVQCSLITLNKQIDYASLKTSLILFKQKQNQKKNKFYLKLIIDQYLEKQESLIINLVDMNQKHQQIINF